MSLSTHRFAVVLGALVVLGSFALAQQVQVRVQKGPIVIGPGGNAVPPGVDDQPKDPDSFGNGLELPKDADRGRMVDAAKDYVIEKDWLIATATLQKLLMFPEDKMVKVMRPDKDGKLIANWVSARKEAERMIAALPPDGLDFYKSKFSADAKEMLDKAKESGRREDLAIVMNYYLHTDAGAVATHMLATRLLDRGDYITAGLCYERLFNREEADKLPPTVLFEAAYAYHMANNTAKEDEMWLQLRNRGVLVKLGPEQVPWDVLKEHVSKIARVENTFSISDYPMPGGRPGRNAKGIGGPPFLEAAWRQQLIHESSGTRTQQVLNDANRMMQRRQAIIPAFQPITVTINVNAVNKPLVVCRTYYGLLATELATGKIAWETEMSFGLDNMLKDSRQSAVVNQWLNSYIQLQGGIRPSIVYENSIVGALSTDGTYVFAVEDLAVPPPPFWFNQFPGGNPQANNQLKGGLGDAMQASKLRAYELATSGKLKWEVGGVGKDVPLGDSYFLGPPLPMGGKVYVLTEKQQELRLACIDANSGKVVSTQALVATREKINTDVVRRTAAAHLAYGEGVLVCPTNAGAVLGVDMLTNSLVWAYNYREEQVNPNPNPNPNPNWRGGFNQPGMQQPIPSSAWKVTPPIIQDGRVIFTAPDASSIHCLNLRDGTPIWTHKRAEEDLYLAGVYNGNVVVVGKRFTKAYSLSKGEEAWQVETGLPNGFGIASDNFYYLPVKESVQSHEPEICIIDVDKGQITAHTKSREKNGKREVPGSLLFYEGDVLSQTETEIVAYPQLKVRELEVTTKLKDNPKNPEGLTDRGELRLDRGELAGAVTDFCAALDNTPSGATRAKARLKLYEALSDYLQRDFNKSEKFLDKYEELCHNVEVDANASEDDKAKAKVEGHKRITTMNFLIAEGKKSQGKLVEAFDKYTEFSKLAGSGELISVPDDPGVRTAPDVWTSARIKAMVESASAEQRKPLEERMEAQWDDLKHNAKGLDDLRQFVRLFGSAFPVGKEARLELANRLIESSEPQALIEAELDLAMLRGAKEDPGLAARAVETLARLNAQKGLLPDAAFYYRELRDRYGKVVVRDGKTGAEIFAEMESNRFLLPHLYEGGPAALGGKVSFGQEVRANGNPNAMNQQGYSFDQMGEELPFFKQYRFQLTNTHNLKVTNRYQAEEPARMDIHLSTTHFFQMTAIYNPMGNSQVFPKYHYMNMGHLVVLPIGHRVFGVDPVEKKLLWEKDLFGPVPGGGGLPQWQPNPQTGMPAITVDPRDGSVQILYQGNWMQRIGQSSSLEGQVICLQTKDALTAIDPLSGRMLWTRSDLNSNSQIISDADHFYIVELNADGNASATRVLRAQDGVSVKAADFAALYQKRVRMVGRHLLLTDTDNTSKKVTMRLNDVLTGKDVWKHEFAAKSVSLHSEDPNFAGIVEPDGKLHVYDMRNLSGEEVFPKAKLEPKHVEKVHNVVLLTDDQNLYVACNTDVDPNLMPWGGIQSNLMPNVGMRSLIVNGELYSFKRADGELNWHNPVPNQMLVMDQFKEMPVMLFTARYTKWVNQGVNKVPMNFVATESIEKLTGKLKYFNESTNQNQQQFTHLNVDVRAGKIELSSWNLKLVHQLIPEGEKEKPAPEGLKVPPQKDGALNSGKGAGGLPPPVIIKN